MNNFYRLFFSITFIAVALLPRYASATSLNIKITGNDVAYIDGNFSQGKLVPTKWNIINGVEPTKSFIPSMYLAQKPETVKLTGNNGEVVDVPLHIKGIEYNYSSNNVSFETNNLVSPLCGTTQLGASTVSLYDNNISSCSANKILKFEGSMSPFYFMRPIIDLNEQELLQSLSESPQGVYRGIIDTTFKYFFESTGGALTYRVVNSRLNVNIDYVPAYLSKITIVGDGVLTPEYDAVNHRVSSSTDFLIKAEGKFTSGLVISFLDDDYYLYSKDKETKIPLSVTCIDANCEDNDWVKDGVLNVTDLETKYALPGLSSKEVEFPISVRYDNVSAESIKSGAYNGNFTLMFEVDL